VTTTAPDLIFSDGSLRGLLSTTADVSVDFRRGVEVVGAFAATAAGSALLTLTGLLNLAGGGTFTMGGATSTGTVQSHATHQVIGPGTLVLADGARVDGTAPIACACSALRLTDLTRLTASGSRPEKINCTTIRTS
jgi:hypothetical protein